MGNGTMVQHRNKYICTIHFETTEGSFKTKHIISISSVLYKICGSKIEFTSDFHEFVQQRHTLSNFCARKTGITQNDVENADIFDIVYLRHFRWLCENVIHHDVSFVPYDNSFAFVFPSHVRRTGLDLLLPYCKYIDLTTDFITFYGRDVDFSSDMLKFFGIDPHKSDYGKLDKCKDIITAIEKMIDDKFLVKSFTFINVQNIDELLEGIGAQVKEITSLS